MTMKITLSGARVVALDERYGFTEPETYPPGVHEEIKMSGRDAFEGKAMIVWPKPVGPGKKLITATVSDGVKELKRELTINIRDNTPPRITSVTAAGQPGSAKFEIGDEIDFRYIARDDDEDENLLSRVTINKEGLEILRQDECRGDPAERYSCALVLRGWKEGIYEVTVEVADRSFAVVRQNMQITIGDPPPPADCGKIDCDCENAGLGAWFIDREYIRTCRATERGLIESCRLNGRIDGGCHPTASGPAAWP